eukprot:g179.t1
MSVSLRELAQTVGTQILKDGTIQGDLALNHRGQEWERFDAILESFPDANTSSFRDHINKDFLFTGYAIFDHKGHCLRSKGDLRSPHCKLQRKDTVTRTDDTFLGDFSQYRKLFHNTLVPISQKKKNDTHDWPDRNGNGVESHRAIKIGKATFIPVYNSAGICHAVSTGGNIGLMVALFPFGILVTVYPYCRGHGQIIHANERIHYLKDSFM